MGTWNKFLEHVSTFTFNSLNWFCKLAPSAHIRYFCEKVNDSSRCIDTDRYICTTICKHTMNSGLCGIFGKFRLNSG